jgi:hypothetical protein
MLPKMLWQYSQLVIVVIALILKREIGADGSDLSLSQSEIKGNSKTFCKLSTSYLQQVFKAKVIQLQDFNIPNSHKCTI